jgi:hypothetical protein
LNAITELRKRRGINGSGPITMAHRQPPNVCEQKSVLGRLTNTRKFARSKKIPDRRLTTMPSGMQADDDPLSFSSMPLCSASSLGLNPHPAVAPCLRKQERNIAVTPVAPGEIAYSPRLTTSIRRRKELDAGSRNA